MASKPILNLYTMFYSLLRVFFLDFCCKPFSSNQLSKPPKNISPFLLWQVHCVIHNRYILLRITVSMKIKDHWFSYQNSGNIFLSYLTKIHTEYQVSFVSHVHIHEIWAYSLNFAATKIGVRKVPDFVW